MAEDKIVLTKEELTRLLDVEIRRRGRWELRGGRYDEMLGQRSPYSEADLPVKAQVVFDSIVSSTKYDKNLLLATRSVKKFNKAYVLRTLKKAIKAGTLKYESRPDELSAITDDVGPAILKEIQENTDKQ
jgi:hypothetical protein